MTALFKIKANSASLAWLSLEKKYLHPIKRILYDMCSLTLVRGLLKRALNFESEPPFRLRLRKKYVSLKIDIQTISSVFRQFVCCFLAA